MNTNNTNIAKLISPELSYLLTGLMFEVHNEIGRYGREKQYCDLYAKKLDTRKVKYEREYVVKDTGNRLDFYVEKMIVVEFKAKDAVNRDDYYQIQRYLQALDARLGFLVNFRQQYLRPKRIVKIETDVRKKFKVTRRD